MPGWLLWLGGFLLAIAGILGSLERIQDFLCKHGLSVACSSQFTLVLGLWQMDTSAGWKAYISNPTEYTGSISDARLVFKRTPPNMPIAMTLSSAPTDWRPSSKCGDTDPAAPTVSLKPQATTELRISQFVGPFRQSNQFLIATMDKQIPERMTLGCEVQVEIVTGDGQHRTIRDGFQCSRLPYPMCR